MWQKKALTASMHGQLLSPTEKKWFYVGFLVWIYINPFFQNKDM
ncbi:hypothetical protein Q9306_17805 [Bacillus sp. WLY-B-L8]|nr:hypothetical protein [Bacillus sp. WLY-B-L8]